MPSDEKTDTYVITLRIYEPAKSRADMVQLLQAILSTKSHSEKNFLFFIQFELVFVRKHLKNVLYDHFSPLVLDFFLICKHDTQKVFIKCPKSKITVTCIVQTILFKCDKSEWLMNSFMVAQSPSTSLFNF